MEDTANVFLISKPSVGKTKVTFEIDIPGNCDSVHLYFCAEARVKIKGLSTLLEKKELPVKFIKKEK